jgi:RNA 3'-terminal phosphate cyclase (ATP)
MSMITLDGNFGEGGGSLLRTALAFSVLTQKPFRIDNIRSNRPKPGLKAQHLEAILALKQICPGSKSSDIKFGKTSMWFHPTQIKAGNYNFDIKTAGSITLFFQAIILPSLFASSKMTITVQGGTCGKWQAGVDFLQRVLLPLIHRFTKNIKLTIKKRGYYPKGGGEVTLEISPLFKSKQFANHQELISEIKSKTKPYQLTNQGKLEHIKGLINISSDLQDKQIGERILKAASQTLRKATTPVSIELGYFPSKSTGGEVLLWTVHSQRNITDPFNSPRISSDLLIEKGKSSELIGEEVAQKLLKLLDTKAAIDSFLCDQLICFATLLKNSKLTANEISSHTKTNIYVIKHFIDTDFDLEQKTITVL